MVQSLISLEDITTGYSIFEKDQVLTHDQLNSVASYLDDEGRLTRVYLLGVGTVCGLQVSLQTGEVHATRGVGVTTDGDLLRFDADMVFDRFKPYDETAPVYAPFYVNNAMLPVFELVATGVTDPVAESLSTFNTDTGLDLAKMVALLLMESYVKDDDLCSGTDCDNLGKDSVNTLRTLLIERSTADLLAAQIATPADAFQKLQQVTTERPIITAAAMTSTANLVAAYRTACDTTFKRLATELSKLFSAGSTFLGDVFPSNPTTGWINRLNAISASFGPTDTSIQYYLDFLKDLVETYNEYRGCLFGQRTVCCPDVTWFPKHLLLGNLAPDTNTDQHRTGFYPSPIIGSSSEPLAHARFLAAKLDTLIANFKVPIGNAVPIRITPSLTEDAGLQDRAIPFYYDINTAKPVHRNWNYRFARRGMEAFNYSYNASLYNAQGGAANPFGSQIGRFSFFRIEGHFGKDVVTAKNGIESEINNRNLPIAVRTALLGSDKGRAVKPPLKYTDLHRFHYLVRQDLVNQLDEVSQFSAAFRTQVETAVNTNVISNAPADNDGAPVLDIANQKHDTLITKTATARAKLNLNYTDYQKDVSWKNDLQDTLKAGAEFKHNLSKVVKTEFSTPFDNIIANSHVQWLDWLDQIIQDKQDSKDDKLLLSKLLSDHPGAEHFAGVTRGGTLILIYDDNRTVVGDFMLPYHYGEEAEDEPNQPPLPKPGIKPPFVVLNPIHILPSLDKFVGEKLNLFQTQITPQWDKELLNVKNVAGAYKESIDMVGNLINIVAKPSAGGTIRPVNTDPFLGLQMRDIDSKRQQVEFLRQQLLEPNITAETQRLVVARLKSAESELAKTFEGAVRYLSTAGIDVSKGSSGFDAMGLVFSSLGSLKEPGALKTARTGLRKVMNETTVPEIKTMIGNILK